MYLIVFAIEFCSIQRDTNNPQKKPRREFSKQKKTKK